MPSKSPAQARLMAAIAHGWKPPKGSGISVPMRVAKEFNRADAMADGGSVKASPRNAALGLIADYLTKLRDFGDKAKIPFTDMGLGELFMGKTPEEVNEWAYGNSPLQVVGGGTGSYVPQIKQGRSQQVADTMFSAPGLGQLARATGRMAYQLPNSVKRAATDFMHASAAANPAVIKRRGGVWKPNSGPELGVRDLLEDTNILPVDSDIRIGRKAWEYMDDVGREIYLDSLRKANNAEAGIVLNDLLNLDKKQAIQKWAEGPFSTYLKKDFASPNDRIRELADMGITHKSMEDVWIPEYGDKEEILARMGKTKAGRDWEDLADSAIWKRSAKDLGAVSPEQRVRAVKEYMGEPVEELTHTDGSPMWVNKETGEVVPAYLNNVPVDEPIHEIHGISHSDLGFDHIIDTLMNSLQSGKLTPEQVMSKNFNIEAAVRHVHQANKEAEKAAVQTTRDQLGTLKPIKEYPEGYKWYELPDTTETKEYMDLANQIGCEGGWCTKEPWAAENYGSGDKRLRVLIDPEGRAVTQMTVQAPRGTHTPTLDDLFAGNVRFENEVRNNMMMKQAGSPEWINGMPSDQQVIDYALTNFPNNRAVKDFLSIDKSPRKAEITELKGLFNERPPQRLHPYIQDQIRSGDYGSVSDPEYAGMIDMGPFSGNWITGYHTPDEAIEAVKKLQAEKPESNYSQWLDELDQLKSYLGYNQ